MKFLSLNLFLIEFFIVFKEIPLNAGFFGVFSKCEKSTVRADKNTHYDFQKHIIIYFEKLKA